MPKLGDFLKSINTQKVSLMDSDPQAEREYVPFVMNRCYSNFIDCIMFASEMNIRHLTEPKMQYDYLMHSIRKKSRFSKWGKAPKIENLELIKEHFGYGNEKAKEAIRILTDDQIVAIKKLHEKGGQRA